MPSREGRAKIWQRMFPKKAPMESDIDWHRLAGIEITGGYIKNAVLRAARMAATEKKADNKKKITMNHLIKALTQETKSMIEFDNARNEHDSQYGYVGPSGYSVGGQKLVQKATEVLHG
jgi:SpoVK/Ycf46/Vps4 family AAA+-type ATPase